jgi:DNA polymerase-4
MAAKLHAAGFTRLGQLAALDARDAARRFGEEGPGLAARARGEDNRPVVPGRETKSVSAETTFETDMTTQAELEAVLWRLCEKLARRLAAKDFSAGGVVLKLKTAGFASRTRAARLAAPSLVPDILFAAARNLLAREVDGTAFRLLGIGASPLMPAADADQPDLADPDAERRRARWAAMENLRQRFGEDAVRRGRGLTVKP